MGQYFPHSYDPMASKKPNFTEKFDRCAMTQMVTFSPINSAYKVRSLTILHTNKSLIGSNSLLEAIKHKKIILN